MQVIIYPSETGGVAVCVPTGEMPIERVLAEHIPPNVERHVVDGASLPAEHSDFFDAWEMDGPVVSVNMQKAREITKQRLRVERAASLTALDVQYMRALETGQDTASIVAEKQRLRDITNTADACTTLAELRELKVV